MIQRSTYQFSCLLVLKPSLFQLPCVVGGGLLLGDKYCIKRVAQVKRDLVRFYWIALPQVVAYGRH